MRYSEISVGHPINQSAELADACRLQLFLPASMNKRIKIKVAAISNIGRCAAASTVVTKRLRRGRPALPSRP